MSPKYVVKKSVAREFTFFRCVFFFLIFPLVILITKIILAKKDVVEFYDDHVIEKSGVVNITENRTSLVGVTGVTVNQSLKGRMFKYGDITCDLVGGKKLYLYGVKNPTEIKNFLQDNFIDVN
ncbi:MAG: PH domain-containing protein, partial [Clostridia bacterium]|nr:PH domain-containing protein [Clostridia bacterium]